MADERVYAAADLLRGIVLEVRAPCRQISHASLTDSLSVSVITRNLQVSFSSEQQHRTGPLSTTAALRVPGRRLRFRPGVLPPGLGEPAEPETAPECKLRWEL